MNLTPLKLVFSLMIITNVVNTSQAVSLKKQPASAAVSQASLFFMNSYISICVAQETKGMGAKQFLQSRDMPMLSTEDAALYLGGDAGTAWSANMPFGKFIIAVRDDGVCSVFAKKTNVKEVELLFNQFTSSLPKTDGYTLSKPEDQTISNNNIEAHMQSYEYSSKKFKKTPMLRFGLTTSNANNVTSQAMVTFLRIANK